MCIITGPGSNGHSHHTPAITSRGSAGRGHMRGSMGGARRNCSRLLARVGAHPLGDVVAGRMRLADWVRFELTPGAHEVSCRYRRVCARIGWA